MDYMENMLTYVKSFLKPFDEAPFNEVDSLVLSWLSYLNYPNEACGAFPWSGVSIAKMFRAELFDQMVCGVWSWIQQDTLELLAAVSASPRFRSVKLSGYVNEVDANQRKQFAAVTFRIQPKLHYIAYRGTDGTFTGWKEDLRLALDEPIPAQLAALKYIEKTAARIRGKIIVGGHSKGGNLAVYAAAKCRPAVQNRVIAVYSHDGPGFRKEFLREEGLEQIRPRLYKTLPQSSLVGMIFEQECEYSVVKSGSVGMAQHNPFLWKVRGCELCRAEELTPDAKLLYRTLNRWIAESSPADRERFIDVVFDILEETGASDFRELGANLQQNIPVIAKKIINLDAETRGFCMKLLSRLAADGIKSGLKGSLNSLRELIEKGQALMPVKEQINQEKQTMSERE